MGDPMRSPADEAMDFRTATFRLFLSAGPCQGLPGSGRMSFSREKKPHDPAQYGYAQDNTDNESKGHGDQKGQLEDQKKEGE